jgi:hypothetical protein
VAVRVALELALIVPVLTLNVALVELAGTVTETGDVRAALLLDKLTLAPPDSAAAANVTVQVAELELPKVAGRHANELIFGGAGGPVTTPPVAVRTMDVPVVVAATGPVTEIVLAGPAATIAFTIATVPLEIVVLLTPYVRQVSVLADAEQDTVLPAAVAAGPAMALIETLAGYAKVHSSAVGSLPAGEVSTRFSATAPLGAATPELKASVSVWAKQIAALNRATPVSKNANKYWIS